MFNMYPFRSDNIRRNQNSNNDIIINNQGNEERRIQELRNINQINDGTNYNNQIYQEYSIGQTVGDMITQIAGAMLASTDIITNTIDTLINSESIEKIASALDGNLNIKLIEESDKYIIKGNLIGVQKKDIDIDYENDYIKIKVKNDMSFTNGTNTFIHIQTSGVNLESNFFVPDVDKKNIKATYNKKTGLLKVILGKKYASIEPSISEEIIDVENYIDL